MEAKLGRAEILSIIETLAEAAAGTQKTALVAVREYLLDHAEPPQDPEQHRKNMEKIYKKVFDSVYQNGGTTWLDAMERYARGEITEAPEPEDSAELMCEYIAETKKWQPVTYDRWGEKKWGGQRWGLIQGRSDK
ncbi:hypothetical protein FACS189445_4650 [Spirochaetia bacterium]|nr:hypothetical protein FACS189445_4650 [Spirochaetia bacterium]